jgi:hypothetical protein
MCLTETFVNNQEAISHFGSGLSSICLLKGMFIKNMFIIVSLGICLF